MSVSLQKGQKVDLTKGNAGLRRVMVGLGWDAAEQQAGLFGGRTQDIDCDAIAFLLNSEGRIESSSDVVFFNNLRHMSGCVLHQGDNLTGEGEGDDEQIMVDLANLPAKYERVVVLVTALVFGELYRYKGEWKFNAVGQPLQVWSIAQLAERYGLPRSVWKR